MIFNVTGGGGTSLNFKVVGGTTQPASPKENTIWVNTSTAIPSWAFSATEPGSPVAGMVWIATGASSTAPAPFNALKKNTLEVYPQTVKQYVNGVWELREAKIYQSETWIQFSAEDPGDVLYEPGDEHSVYTGGWVKSDEQSSDDFWDYTGGAFETPVEKTSEGIRLYYSGANKKYNCSIRTARKVDLSGYSTLTIKSTPSGNTGNLGVVQLFTAEPPHEYGKGVVSTDIPWSNKNVEAVTNIDVSGVTEPVYIVIGVSYKRGQAASPNVYNLISYVGKGESDK